MNILSKPDVAAADAAINPIRLEIMRNALIAVAEEMSVAITRTARSMMVREGRDYSTAIFDAQGRNLAQAALIPIQLNTMAPCLEEVLAHHLSADQWDAGDVVILNDPYCGAQHLNDVTTFSPIFIDDVLIGFTGVMCHHTDVGSPVAGSFNMQATEIFAEGIRIPPIKIYRRGVLNADILALVLQNVREPETMRGDLNSQIGALDIGARGIAALVAKYGLDMLARSADQILAQAEEAMRRAIMAFPEGSYAFEDVVDDETTSEGGFRIAVKLTFRDGRVIVDMAGSSDQVAQPINCTYNIAKSCVYCAILTGIADHIPPSSGCYAVIDYVAPPGSIVNCRHPAPVAARSSVGHRIWNVIMGALSKARPDRIPAAYYGVTYVNFLDIKLAEGRSKIFFDFEVGGWGGEPTRDGANGFSCGTHNVANLPIEMHETECPITFLHSGFIPDSGGAGQYRGGLGLVREWRLDGDHGNFSASRNRIRSSPYGLFGGGPGRRSRTTLIRAAGEEIPLDALIHAVPMGKGDRIRLETAGGGGFGDPAARDPALVRHDVEQGYVTAAG